MFQIPFTQFISPNGRPRQIFWECASHEQEVKARALLDAGAKFEAEKLQTEQASLTVEMIDNSGEYQTLAHEICMNNPEVIDAVARLVERAHETMIKGAQI